jgi:hypothetical protein
MPSSNSRAERVHQAIGVETMGAARGHDVRAVTHVFDEGELQQRRPCPELAHRQGCDRLKSRDETMQPLRVEAAGAAANQLARHRIDPWQSGELISGNPREPAEERGRQIVVNVTHRCEDDVEVIEQPLRSGG